MNRFRKSFISVLLVSTLPVFASDFSTRDNSTPGPNWIPEGTHFVIRLQALHLVAQSKRSHS